MPAKNAMKQMVETDYRGSPLFRLSYVTADGGVIQMSAAVEQKQEESVETSLKRYYPPLMKELLSAIKKREKR